jgi:hypothetical protein
MSCVALSKLLSILLHICAVMGFGVPPATMTNFSRQIADKVLLQSWYLKTPAQTMGTVPSMHRVFSPFKLNSMDLDRYWNKIT